MNYRCICKNCGEIYYSATSINYHVEKRCQKCGGELIEFSNKPKLGEILTALGLLDEVKLAIALNLQSSLNRKVPLGRILLWMNFISQRELTKVLDLQRKLF